MVLTATVLAGSAVTACSGGGGRSPSTTVSSFLAAWSRGDGPALEALVDRPPAGLAAILSGITAGLHATSVSRSASRPTVHGSQASSTLTSVYTLPGTGQWKVSSTVHLDRRGADWYVRWSPALVAPGLAGGERLAVEAQWAPRAAITGAGGQPLTVQGDVVEVGVEGARVKDPAALTALLVGAGAPAAAVSAALSAAAAHPTFFEPVLQLTDAGFAALGGDSGALYQAPGTVFRHTTSRAAVTPGLGAHLVGSVGPITADELGHLGAPYTATSTVGQGGLESYYERQLAGTPGATIEIVTAGGRVVSTVATFAPVAGRPVATSIDPAVQVAAEQALSTLGGAGGTAAGGVTAGFVALRVSTGEILASLSLPATAPFDSALNGAFPPGSTFKILTSTALFRAGLSPASPASCPTTADVDGEVFHNAQGDRPVSDVAGAFTESCNTAFIQLASSDLHATDFTAAATLYGLGSPIHMGYPAFAGRVPPPADGAALAATAIGQAGVVVSPLDMAAVAADVARGSVREPRLVAGAPSDSAPPRPLDPTVTAELKSMMASVVATGTAAGTGLPAGTYAKTGTAEYGTGGPPPIDAWLVGWHGDVAFAMVVQDSRGDGGPVDGPVIARFLDALPSSVG